MNRKILYGYLPIFLSLVVMFVPMRAAAAVGVGSLWDGLVQLTYARPILYLDNTYVMVETPETSEGLTQPYYTLATYNGNQTIRVEIDSDYTDVYLNGSVRKRVSVVPVSQYDTSHLQYLNVYCEPVSLNGVYISTELIEYGPTCTYDVYIEFDNYYVDQSEITLPLNVQYSFTSWYETNRNFNIDEYIWLNMSVSGDYAGTIQKYDSLEDVPSLDGYFAEQNQTIINQSQTQNNLTNQQNTIIQNQTSQQHQDSQAEINQGIANSQAQINQSIQNTDQITNGYNSSQMGDAENKFESGAGDLTDIEDTLTDSSSTYVSDFTNTGFDTSFLQSVGPSLNYVVTWFTNFWNMGGALTSTYGLSFAIFIAFYILRVRG